jgi:hypothetical protein
MAIELPREVDDLDRRLATLEDPAFAAHLLEENPSLYVRTLARRDEEARKRTRWSAWLAGTAIVSLAAGIFASPFVTKHHAAPAMPPAPRHAAVAAPPRPAPAHPRALPKPRAFVVPQPRPAPVVERVAAPTAHHALAPLVVPRPQPKLAAQPRHAVASAPAHALPAPVAAAPAPAAVAAAPAPAGESQADRLLAMPDPALPGYTKAAPPGGGLSEHGAPVVITRDPCTPQGGRIGSVLLGSIAR